MTSRTRQSRRALTVTAAVASALAVLLSACSGTVGTVTQDSSSPSTTGSASPSASIEPDPALAGFYDQTLAWTGCRGTFQCAKLTVPLDYSAPTGATIQIAVLRLPATNPGARIGSLVVNPGGPGASGVAFVRAARSVFSAKLRARYDIVGFDPRGVGSSNPVHCLDDKQTDAFLAIDGSPDTSAEVRAIDGISKSFARACATRSPTVYAHIGTRDATRDIDVLRAALGDPKLYWFGFSYGTFLGATYAEMFPTHVARMVLDGAMDPNLSNVELIHGQAKGFEVALHRFVQDCARRADCPLPRGEQAAVDRMQTFFSGLDARPLAAIDPHRPLTQALAMNAVLSFLYFPAYGDWDQLRIGLQSAFDGDGSVLLAMLDDRNGRNDSGHYTDNGNAALYAVSALDRPDRPDAAQSAVLAHQWAKESPVFGAYMAWGLLPYQYWDAAATDPPHEIHALGSPKILVVGTTYDPATPYPWAQSLARQLSQGVLLTHVGDGHTAYGKGSQCTNSAVDHYLLTGVTPPVGTVCR